MNYITIKKVFNKEIPNWTNSYKSNKTILEVAYNYFNDVLQNRGFVFLRDVYEFLEIPITQESCDYGWHELINDSIDLGDFCYNRIGRSSDLELTFKCYPIKKYLPIEDLA